MNAISDILGQVPLDQLADELGTDPGTAEQAARAAIASLVGGMQSNAADPDGEASLAGALQEHAASGWFDTNRVDLSQVDTADGAKIVQHVLGGEDQQVQSLGGLGGLLGNAQVQKLLKMLAPIVIGYLANQVISGKYGDILGQILGGGQQQQRTPEPEPKRGGGGLGDILGQILGGGAAQQPAQPEPQVRTPQADSPFNTPRGDEPADTTFPVDETVDDGQDRHDQQAQRKQEGGGDILGDILGGIFGKR